MAMCISIYIACWLGYSPAASYHRWTALLPERQGPSSTRVEVVLCVLQAQVQHMTKKWHVYLTADSRISMAGLSSSTCRYLAEAINDAVRSA